MGETASGAADFRRIGRRIAGKVDQGGTYDFIKQHIGALRRLGRKNVAIVSSAQSAGKFLFDLFCHAKQQIGIYFRKAVVKVDGLLALGWIKDESGGIAFFP